MHLRLTARFWALLVVMGVAIGLCAAALMGLLRIVQHFVWVYQSGPFYKGVAHTSPLHRVVAMIAGGIIGGVAMWLLQRSMQWKRLDVDASIRKGTGRLPALQTTLTALLSMTLVGIGESLGREQSIRQVGALIGSKLAELTKLSQEERRILTALGSGTGMGAVYNMPIGGALFALEVLLGALSLELVLPAIALGAVATLASWVYLPARGTYHFGLYPLWGPQVAWAFVAGPLIGAASALYVRLIQIAKKHRPNKGGLLVAPVAVFAAVGALAVAYPQLLGNGKDIVQAVFEARWGMGLVAALLLLKPLCTAASVASGVPGGLFTPTLTYGALLGSLLGGGWSLIDPGGGAGTYALIGAGAMLGAATQGPLSAIVMLIELAHHGDVHLVPIVIATAGATAVSRALVRQSIYVEKF